MDNIIYYVISIAIIIYAFISYKRSRQKIRNPRVNALRSEYIRKAGLPRGTADEHIDNYIRRLQEKHPGRSEDWYLEKMLFDLERDKS